MTTALPNKHYSGHHKATDEESDQGPPGEEIWSHKVGQQDSNTARERWRWHHKTELSLSVLTAIFQVNLG